MVQLLKKQHQDQVWDQVEELSKDHLQDHTKKLLEEKQVLDQEEATSDDRVDIFIKINTSWQFTFLKNHILFSELTNYNLANKIKCSHILVQKQSEAIAILDKIRQGEKFGKLARELSVDSGSAKRDGNLGYFSRGKMVKEFETAAFNLEVGEISEPVKTQYGYHIIKRLS